MKVSTKGQVTIPIEIREKLGIQPGAEVEFIIEGNTVRMVRTEPALERGRRIVERLRGSATGGMTTDEIMALMRGEE
jgi:AbrB family looped-hinge helix DNA binding protein